MKHNKLYLPIYIESNDEIMREKKRKIARNFISETHIKQATRGKNLVALLAALDYDENFWETRFSNYQLEIKNSKLKDLIILKNI